MDNETPLQRHTQIMLDELGMNPQQFETEIIARTGKRFSKTSIYNWRDGTSRTMQLSKAEQINKAFPQFPVDWLQGFTEARTFEEKQRLKENALIAEWNRDLRKGLTMIGCVEGLVELTDTSIDYKFEDNIDDLNKSDDVFGEIDNIEIEKSVVLTRDEQLRVIPDEQWKSFVTEVMEYVDMRINSLFERGY